MQPAPGHQLDFVIVIKRIEVAGFHDLVTEGTGYRAASGYGGGIAALVHPVDVFLQDLGRVRFHLEPGGNNLGARGKSVMAFQSQNRFFQIQAKRIPWPAGRAGPHIAFHQGGAVMGVMAKGYSHNVFHP